MRLHILSDLHVEFDDFVPPETSADVVVLAGDTHVGLKGIEWATQAFPDKPVLYVPGNHEFYRQAIPKHIHKLREAAAGTNVHVLENEALRLDGVLFAGCTLWTDFRLFGDPKIAGYHATQRMTDFRLIRVSPEYRKFRSIDAAGIHAASVRWLRREIGESGAPTVVITHHAPCRKSIPDQYGDDLINAAYVSDLEDVIESFGPQLWIHGHIHWPRDYRVGSTRVLANPRGYPGELDSNQFDAGRVVEVV